MAKALLGYVVSNSTRALDENLRLRRRIADLEAIVSRLQAENDTLAAQAHEGQFVTVPDHIRPHAGARA